MVGRGARRNGTVAVGGETRCVEGIMLEPLLGACDGRCVWEYARLHEDPRAGCARGNSDAFPMHGRFFLPVGVGQEAREHAAPRGGRVGRTQCACGHELRRAHGQERRACGDGCGAGQKRARFGGG